MTEIRTFNAVRLPIKDNHRSNTQYQAGDIVHNTADDLAYLATADHIGTTNPATDSANWEILTAEIANKYLLYATDINPQTIDTAEVLGYFEIGDGGEKRGLLVDGFNLNGQGSPTQDKGSIHNIPNGSTPVHFKLIIDKPVLNGHTFGFQGDFKGADRYRWKPLLNFASSNRLKIEMMSNQKYIFDNVGIINNEEFFMDIDFCGSTIKRFIDAKTIPLNKQEPILLGTIDKVKTSLGADERILTQNITFTSPNNSIENDFTRVHVDTKFKIENNTNTIPANVGDIVIVDNRKNEIGLFHRLITGPGEKDFLEQGFGKTDDFWRDRYFVGTYDPSNPDSPINLQKRGVIASEIVNGMTELETISNSTTSAENNNVLIHEFKEGEEIYLFHYKSSYEIGDTLEGTVLTEAIDNVTNRSLFRLSNETQWRLTPNTVFVDNNDNNDDNDDIPIRRNLFGRLDEQKNIYTHAMALHKFDSFKMANYVYDGERMDTENINLDVNTMNNTTIWYSDQTYPIDWYSFISTSGITTTRGNKFEINNFQHKNNSLYLMMGSPASCDIKEIKIRDGRSYDSGGIYFVGVEDLSKKANPLNVLDVQNIVDEDPYFKQTFNGVASRGYKRTYYRNIEKIGTSFINFGRGEDVIDIKDLYYTNPFSKKLEFSAEKPFFNGRSLPILNGGGYALLGKYGDTGYRKNSRFSISGVKINRLFHEGRYQVDIDPVTGSMGIYRDFATVQYTRTEDGAGNLIIEDSELIGETGFIGPNTPPNSANQDVGGMNGQVKNCTFKHHSDIIRHAISGSQETTIKNLTIISIDPSELIQDRFYHSGAASRVNLAANTIDGVKDFVGCNIGMSQFAPHLGFATLLNDPNRYDLDTHTGPFDNGAGGPFTTRSPKKTEIYLGGEEKLVHRESDLILPFFTERYKGGIIRSLEILNGNVGTPKFYQNTSNDLSDPAKWTEVQNLVLNADGTCEDCETYDRGDKKIVPNKDDLSVQEGNFHDLYRGGLIEVNDPTEVVPLSPGISIRGRYFNNNRLKFRVGWNKENEGNEIPPQRIIYKNIQSPFCGFNGLSKAVKFTEENDPSVTFLLENITNLYITISANRRLNDYEDSPFKFSKSIFMFKNVDIVQHGNISDDQKFPNIGLNNYWSNISIFDLISSKEQFPVLKSYEGCRLLNIRNKEGIVFTPITIDNAKIQEGDLFTWIHPQLKRLHLLTSVLNLDLSVDGFVHSLDNQELEIVIDDRSSDQAQIIHASIDTDLGKEKGSYRFYVNKEDNVLVFKGFTPLPA